MSGSIRREYTVYSLLDPEWQKAACEIAKKYPYDTEHVAGVLLTTGFNQEETEKYIMQELALTGGYRLRG